MDNQQTIQELIEIIKQQNNFILQLMNSELLTYDQQEEVAKKYNGIYLKAGKYLNI